MARLRNRSLFAVASGFRQRSDGQWRRLVARFVRDEEVAGSNPVAPTKKLPSPGGFFSKPDSLVDPGLLLPFRRPDILP